MASIPRISGVYSITCEANQRIYVGSSIDIRKRFNAHRSLLRTNKHPNIYLQRAWIAYGKESFVFTILETVDCQNLLEREQYWIDAKQSLSTKAGFNISVKAGAPMAGLQHTEETKQRMARSQTGRTHSDETRAKISAHNKGRVHSREAIEKSRQSNIGRKASEATRAKLREAHRNPSPELRYKMGSASRGKKRPIESIEKTARAQMKEYIITSPEGFVFHIAGLRAFCREYGLDQGSMSAVITGRRKDHKGWTARRAA